MMLQLCGSALPLIALIDWAPRRAPDGAAVTVAIDIAVLVFLTGFLYWSLIIAPASDPSQAAGGLRVLSIVGPIVRLASVSGLLLALQSARKTSWVGSSGRLAAGMAISFVI